MRRAHRVSSCGQSLVEVLIAVAVTAVTVLGLIAVQLSIARDARAMSYREQAALVADAVAEAARAPAVNDAALGQWKLRAASLLPKGDAAVTGSSADLSFARTTWVAQPFATRTTPGAADGTDMPASCGDVEVPRGVQCVVMAFSR